MYGAHSQSAIFWGNALDPHRMSCDVLKIIGQVHSRA